MKFRLQGTPEELKEKGPQLLKAVADQLGLDLDDPDLLQKSEPNLPESRYRPLRDLQHKAAEIYQEEMELMLKEIGKVLDQ